LFADATGTCVFAKRLDKGVFSLPASPAADATHVEVDESALDALLDGLELAPSPLRQGSYRLFSPERNLVHSERRGSNAAFAAFPAHRRDDAGK